MDSVTRLRGTRQEAATPGKWRETSTISSYFQGSCFFLLLLVLLLLLILCGGSEWKLPAASSRSGPFQWERFPPLAAVRWHAQPCATSRPNETSRTGNVWTTAWIRSNEALWLAASARAPSWRPGSAAPALCHAAGCGTERAPWAQAGHSREAGVCRADPHRWSWTPSQRLAARVHEWTPSRRRLLTSAVPAGIPSSQAQRASSEATRGFGDATRTHVPALQVPESWAPCPVEWQPWSQQPECGGGRGEGTYGAVTLAPAPHHRPYDGAPGHTATSASQPVD